ncbi:MAG: response regulator transcription factor [Epsilonproteobacteria bacterium]|nr:response regulator transcription factor [Campylobacterota bacterium]
MIDYDKVYNATKNFNVLFVEDDLSFLKETKMVFQELFYSVDSAIDGEEGLKKYKTFLDLKKTSYDIVITDISMPSMDGIELTKEIYKINKNQSIIIISAHDESKYLLELINIGIEQFLIKPIDFDILLNVLFGVVANIKKNNIQTDSEQILKLKNNFFWDKHQSLLMQNENIVKLTKKETFLMQLFIKNGSKVSTFQEILDTTYDDPLITSDDIIKPLVSRLRKKIPEQTIENIYGLGYRLIF